MRLQFRRGRGGRRDITGRTTFTGRRLTIRKNGFNEESQNGGRQ